MNIDLGDLSMIQLMGYRSYFETRSNKVHIYVQATKKVLEDNPQMAGHVLAKDLDEQGFGYVIFNISSAAVRNIHREDQCLVFNARFKGVEYTIRVAFGDIIGIGTDITEELILDPVALLMSRLSGTGIILRPLNTADEEQPTAAPEAPIEPASKRPTLTVVK